MPSEHGAFCQSPHGAFIQSPHAVRGCDAAAGVAFFFLVPIAFRENKLVKISDGVVNWVIDIPGNVYTIEYNQFGLYLGIRFVAWSDGLVSGLGQLIIRIDTATGDILNHADPVNDFTYNYGGAEIVANASHVFAIGFGQLGQEKLNIARLDADLSAVDELQYTGPWGSDPYHTFAPNGGSPYRRSAHVTHDGRIQTCGLVIHPDISSPSVSFVTPALATDDYYSWQIASLRGQAFRLEGMNDEGPHSSLSYVGTNGNIPVPAINGAYASRVISAIDEELAEAHIGSEFEGGQWHRTSVLRGRDPFESELPYGYTRVIWEEDVVSLIGDYVDASEDHESLPAGETFFAATLSIRNGGDSRTTNIFIAGQSTLELDVTGVVFAAEIARPNGGPASVVWYADSRTSDIPGTYASIATCASGVLGSGIDNELTPSG